MQPRKGDPQPHRLSTRSVFILRALAYHHPRAVRPRALGGGVRSAWVHRYLLNLTRRGYVQRLTKSRFVRYYRITSEGFAALNLEGKIYAHRGTPRRAPRNRPDRADA